MILPAKQYDELAKIAVKMSNDIFDSVEREKEKETELTTAMINEAMVFGKMIFVIQFMKPFKRETITHKIKRIIFEHTIARGFR